MYIYIYAILSERVRYFFMTFTSFFREIAFVQRIFYIACSELENAFSIFEKY
jgi:hypothetical protein